ncbi:Rac GTPase-activating protein 1 [Fasciola gigantica]|uniref:Rac GTPase-activating protein 1 n=1 Tax=Fasciola gigantica TaxID=46835 RepID=A0A504Z542_FASGI|nr:Rac GTPase-activating protein 1 [Fasciola gigantica]
MASSKVGKRRHKTNNHILLYDSLITNSSELFGHAQCADQTSVKLLDLLCRCQDRWSLDIDRLRSNCQLLEARVNQLRTQQEEAAEMLYREKESTRRAELARESLKRKIDAIREVLVTNDVDEAKRRLDDVELSAVVSNELRNNTRLDHSAGSLLDPVNVSIESHEDGTESSFVQTVDSSKTPARRSMRMSKFRSSSVPKFTSNSVATTDILKSNGRGSVELQRVSRKRNSDKSDDSYFGVEVKRSVFTSQAHQSLNTRGVVPSTVAEESSRLYSSDAVNVHHSSDALHVTPANPSITPKPATLSRLNRPHNFTSRSVLRMDVCSACGRRIGFGKTAYKCTVCRLLVHPTCRKALAQTCVPPSATRTPLSTMNHPRAWATSPRRAPSNAITSRALVPALPFGSPKSKRTATVAPPTSPTLSVRLGLRNVNLTDFCPADQFPRIPALIIHCVTEVVARGMNTVGLYRVSGSEKQVRDLYDKFFRTKMTPGLALVEDIHVVCGCLKLFLRNLSEPLVTFEQRPVLAAASERVQIDPEDAVHRAIDVLDCLPAPNRDTLSYIVLHLKVVKLLFSVPEHVYSAILSSPPEDTNSGVDQDETNYFSPLSVLVDHGDVGAAGRTPMRLRQTPRGVVNLGMSRKRFLPSFLSSNRTATDV